MTEKDLKNYMNAASPIENPVRCFHCGSEANFRTAIWYYGRGVTFIHQKCEDQLMKNGRVYATFYGTKVGR